MKLECVPDVIELLVEDIIPADALTPPQYTLVSVSEKLKEKGLALPKRQSLSVLQSPVVYAEAAAVERHHEQTIEKRTEQTMAQRPQQTMERLPELIASLSPVEMPRDVSSTDTTASARMSNSEDNFALPSLHDVVKATKANALLNSLSPVAPAAADVTMSSSRDSRVSNSYQDYPPAEVYDETDLKISVTYVDHVGCIHAQPVYPGKSLLHVNVLYWSLLFYRDL